MLKKFLIGTIATLAFVVAFAATSASADCSITTTLRVGSKGAEVSCLQTKVGATADGSFGPMTKASVMAYQASHGLSSDGVVGPMSRAVLNAGGAVSGSFSAGCTSASGFSATTGLSCVSLNANTFAPSGCTSASGFSPVTGGACYAVSSTIAGCTAGAAFSSTTGASCTTGVVTTTTGPLAGGAGDATLTHYATSEKGTISEGQTDVKVLGFRVEATDSDIALQNVKVTIINSNASDAPVSSYRIDRYLDSVDVYMGSTKVGSANVADFTKDSTNLYSKSIALSNAVVRNGDKSPFYVVFNAASSMDTANDNATLTVVVDTYRFQDATGVIMTNNADNTVTNDVTIDSTNDTLSLLSSSNNPDTSTITVDESNTTDEVLALAFKLKAGSNSSDITLDTLPINIKIVSAGATTSSDVIDSVVVKIGSKTITADEPATADMLLNHAAGNVTYTADFSNEGIVIAAGETVEAKVYITFVEQGGTPGNYTDGATTVKASIVTDTITAESNNTDTILASGTSAGAELTLSTSANTLSNISWAEGSSTTVGNIDFFFTVSATNGEYNLLLSELIASETLSSVTAVIGTPVLTVVSGDAAAVYDVPAGAPSEGFTVSDGGTTNFRLRYGVTALGSAEVKITSVAGQEVPVLKQVSPTLYANSN